VKLQRLIPLIAALLAVSLPAVATAQDDGVTVDPDSPTGKEYAIPLERARQEAAGARGSGAETPLFGEGVSASPGAQAKTPDATGSASDPEPRKGGSAATPSAEAAEAAPSATRDPEVAQVVAQAAEQPGAPGGTGSTVLVAGGGVALVAAAAAAGLAARRRRPD
jgi:hypothetical protein